MIGTAQISPCGRYRYTLERRWRSGSSRAVFIMLNPSTADALQDDPTIRRCIGFSQREGHDALTILNLCAFRATDPEEMHGHAKVHGHAAIFGPENLMWITKELANQREVICAWGAHGDRLTTQVDSVRRILEVLRVKPLCFGTTKSGQPKHPLYLSATAPLVAWRPDP